MTLNPIYIYVQVATSACLIKSIDIKTMVKEDAAFTVCLRAGS